MQSTRQLLQSVFAGHADCTVCLVGGADAHERILRNHQFGCAHFEVGVASDECMCSAIDGHRGHRSHLSKRHDMLLDCLKLRDGPTELHPVGHIAPGQRRRRLHRSRHLHRAQERAELAENPGIDRVVAVNGPRFGERQALTRLPRKIRPATDLGVGDVKEYDAITENCCQH